MIDAFVQPKNAHGSIATMDVDQRRGDIDSIERALDAADRQAQSTSLRYSHQEVFGLVREMLVIIGQSWLV